MGSPYTSPTAGGDTSVAALEGLFSGRKSPVEIIRSPYKGSAGGDKRVYEHATIFNTNKRARGCPGSLDLLRETLPLKDPNDRISYGGELKDVPHDQLVLFYRDKNNVAGCIDLPGTLEALDKLVSACEPASVESDDEGTPDDTHDDSYQKALQLGLENSAISFNPEKLGLVQIVRDLLFKEFDDRTIRADMFKLNIYTQDGFFKDHKQTSTDEDMIGSLVVVLPTAHQGGSLVVRTQDDEMEYDTSNDGSDTTVHWAASFSNTQHEIETVTDGHKLILTYILFTDTKRSNGLEGTNEEINREISEEISEEELEELDFYNELANQLQNMDFYPRGGILGFGLKHKYPFPKRANPQGQDTIDINTMTHHLKFTDRTLYTIGIALGLKTELVYTFRFDRPEVKLMTSMLGDFPGLLCKTYSTYERVLDLMEYDKAEIIEDRRNRYDMRLKKTVDWITPSNENNVTMWEWIPEAHYYAQVERTYGYCALTMRVPKWSEERGIL